MFHEIMRALTNVTTFNDLVVHNSGRILWDTANMNELLLSSHTEAHNAHILTSRSSLSLIVTLQFGLYSLRHNFTSV